MYINFIHFFFLAAGFFRVDYDLGFDYDGPVIAFTPDDLIAFVLDLDLTALGSSSSS
jgi:hypothetical protein